MLDYMYIYIYIYTSISVSKKKLRSLVDPSLVVARRKASVVVTVRQLITCGRVPRTFKQD